jgi:hypothetical protein
LEQIEESAHEAKRVWKEGKHSALQDWLVQVIDLIQKKIETQGSRIEALNKIFQGLT